MTPTNAKHSGLERTSPTPDLDALRRAYGHLDGKALLEVMIRDVFPGRIALSSSFGAEAVVLLDLVAQVDPATPVLVIDTLKLFPETYAYIEMVTKRLGLTDVRRLKPDAARLRRWDPDGNLWETEPDSCCHIRKVVPLDAALPEFDAWITGRKRFHGGQRSDLPVIEFMDGQFKINPLAPWSQAEIDAAFAERDLPAHPLVAEGYLSIGCQTCTRRVVGGEEVRAGRWAGSSKNECGIHLGREQAAAVSSPQSQIGQRQDNR